MIGVCSEDTPQFCDRSCETDQECKFTCGCGCISRDEICWSNVICKIGVCHTCRCVNGKCESWFDVFKRALDTKDVALCDKIKPISCKNMCYKILAIDTKNITLCDKISSVYERTTCRDVVKQKYVIITTDKTEYEQGEMVKVTIKNNLNKSVDIVYQIEKITEEKIIPVHIRSQECPSKEPLELPIETLPEPLPANSAKEFLWDQRDICTGIQQTGGAYRVKAGVTVKEYEGHTVISEEKFVIYSNEFTIKEKPSKITCGWCGRTCVKYPISEEDCKDAGGIFLKRCACREVAPPEGFICVEENGKCVKKSKQVTITTDKTEYELGEAVKITIRNDLDKSISYRDWDESPCVSAFSMGRKENGGYKDFYSLGTARCITSVTELKPNMETTYQLDIIKLTEWSEVWKVKFPGTYKLEFVYYPDAGSLKTTKEETIYSNEFTIKEKEIIVEGRIVAIGNEPFVQLTIETDDIMYGLSGDTEELWRTQGKKVRVKGYLRGRTLPSFRTEKGIEVMSFEIIE